ncbi:MAG: hypothetical protein V7700_15780 [Halioglobus sp.]
MSSATRRYYRTIVLAVLAMAALIWVAMDQFGISRQEMTELFLGTVVAALVIILCAGAITLLWVGLRKLLRRDEE